MTAWGVRYARQFHEQLMALGDTTYARVEASIDVLASNPGLARPYDRPMRPRSARALSLLSRAQNHEGNLSC